MSRVTVPKPGPVAFLRLGCQQPAKAFLRPSHPSLDLADLHKNSRLLLLLPDS